MDRHSITEYIHELRQSGATTDEAVHEANSWVINGIFREPGDVIVDMGAKTGPTSLDNILKTCDIQKHVRFRLHETRPETQTTGAIMYKELHRAITGGGRCQEGIITGQDDDHWLQIVYYTHICLGSFELRLKSYALEPTEANKDQMLQHIWDTFDPEIYDAELLRPYIKESQPKQTD